MERNLVGARELRVHLGTYLRRVRQGHTLVVTHRGQPVAVLRPTRTAGAVETILAKLEAGGAVTLATRKRLPPFRPIKLRGESVASAVLKDREELR